MNDLGGDWAKAGELIDAIASCGSRDAARSHVATFLEENAGTSAAFIGRMAPREIDAGYIRHVPAAVRDRFLGDAGRYARSLLWHIATANACGGVSRHPLERLLASGDLISQEILEPVGPRTVLGGPITLGGKMCGVFYFGHEGVFENGAGMVRLAGRALGLAEMMFGDVELPCVVDANDAAPEARPGKPLTKREREVLEYLALGYTNAEIGMACGSAMNTVKRQLASAFRKLGVCTRAEAVRVAMLEGHVVARTSRRTFC